MTKDEGQLPVLFLGGHRKSGTTMFRDLFDDHPQLHLYPTDLTLLYAYYPDFIAKHESVSELKERLDLVIFQEVQQALKLGNAFNQETFQHWRDKFYSEMDNAGGHYNDIEAILKTLFRTFHISGQGRSSNAASERYFVAKETSMEIYAHDLMTWFPDSRFIQLIRDPRDNYAALKAGVESYYSRLGEDESLTLFSLIHRLSIGMKCGQANLATFGAERYKLLKFEDLVANAQNQMQAVCAWLGIDFDNKLLAPSKLGQVTGGNNFEGKDFKHINASHSGAWKERISDQEAMIIEFHLGDIMQQYGYDLVYQVTESRKAAASFYKWSNYKYFYSDRFAA